MLDACERASLDVGDIQLPAIRRRVGEARWAPLSKIYDWTDDRHRTLNGQWLARACAVPMLRRGLGPRRVEALRSFLEDTEFHLDPDGAVLAGWAPLLAADLASRRRKATRQNWEDFYVDLASLRPALPHMRGAAIFRLEDGSLGAANSPETLDQRELFISADPDNATRRRKRLAGTTLFPPRSVAQRMHFADPLFSWPAAVTTAFVSAGLATEYSLPRVIAGMGRLLGKRPSRQTATAAVNWTFLAWKAHKTTELEKALPIANLPVPSVGGKLRPANASKFGAGWRDTSGDTLAELCGEIGSSTRATKSLCDCLLIPWEEWPLREKGTAAEWVQFLRLLGVRDGLTPVYHRAVSQHVNHWRWLRSGAASALAVEAQLGDTWRTAVADSKANFGYMSGDYSTGDTLFALPLQVEQPHMSDRAKRAYAQLVVRAIPELAPRHLTTILSRTAGMGDTVAWPSPLLGFLTEAEWLPVTFAEQVTWRRPRECWFVNRSETLPRFLPRLERPIRDAIDANAATRDMFAKRLGLRVWNERGSAVARLTELGDVLGRGIAEHEHDSFRSEYRQAWADWSAGEPVEQLPDAMPLAVQSTGRLVPHVPDPERPGTIFVSGGGDPTLDNLLMALRHRLLSVPADAARAVAEALGSTGGEPTFLTDQQRDLIGFAGEYAAYVHLKRTVRNFADEHWVSSLGRRYLGLLLVPDGGFDFRVPRWRGGLHYEVKAHTGDPGHVDLEGSQVEAAVHFADEKAGSWRILYIANVLDPNLITVHELANPFSEGNMRMFRPSNRQGVRLLIDRQ